MISHYIFNRNAGLSVGCRIIFPHISFAISSASSGLPDLETRSQITVKIHSRSGIINNKCIMFIQVRTNELITNMKPIMFTHIITNHNHMPSARTPKTMSTRIYKLKKKTVTRILKCAHFSGISNSNHSRKNAKFIINIWTCQSAKNCYIILTLINRNKKL